MYKWQEKLQWIYGGIIFIYGRFPGEKIILFRAVCGKISNSKGK
jgi:hypothetical protein